jgi:hypothetical protein
MFEKVIVFIHSFGKQFRFQYSEIKSNAWNLLVLVTIHMVVFHQLSSSGAVSYIMIVMELLVPVQLSYSFSSFFGSQALLYTFYI